MTSTTTTSRARGHPPVAALLRDPRFDRPTRLMRLQGWRGDSLDDALAAGSAHRLAPGFCAAGASIVALSGSWSVSLVLALTAIVGVFARNHPVEAVYNAAARRSGRPPIPPNRAAKRLGCLLGTLLLGASTLALLLGAAGVGQVVAASFAAVAWVVMLTNVCVPSMIFVALFGAERSTSRRLI